MEDELLTLVREAIKHGWAWACDQCHWSREECPIWRLAERVGVEGICDYDEKKYDELIDRMFREIGVRIQRVKEVSVDGDP